MKPLFSLKFTSFLGIALFLPFILKTLSPKLEPYPAIILPSGAKKLNFEKEVLEVRSLSIYGYHNQGELQRVSAKKILEPIPKQYLYSLAKNEFGLSTKTTDEVRIKGLGKKLEIKRKQISSEEQKSAKNWLSNQLRKQGLSPSNILIKQEIKKLDLDEGKQVSKEIKNENNIPLH